MRPLKIDHFVRMLGLLLLLLWKPVFAKTAPETEIHVTLLGQPCLLRGPFDEPSLKTIHSIGPAQLYADISFSDLENSNKLAHKALEKIRPATNSLPSLLDRYREKLGRRLDAQVALLDAFDHSTAQNAMLTKIGKKYLKPADYKKYEKIAGRLFVGAAPGAKIKITSQKKEIVDQLFDTYNDGIEPDPEEEFHRAIKKMGVEYVCSFDESSEGNEGGGE